MIDDDDAGNKRWQCWACTFENCGVMSVCELCDASRPSTSRKQKVVNDSSSSPSISVMSTAAAVSLHIAAAAPDAKQILARPEAAARDASEHGRTNEASQEPALMDETAFLQGAAPLSESGVPY